MPASALPLVPREARREPCPKARTSLRKGEPGQPRSAGCSRQHHFDDYRSKKDEPDRGPRVLVTGEAAQIEEMVRLAEATALVRDLVNTPAADLGPAELEAGCARRSQATVGAQLRVTAGNDLAEGYPLIAAVGGAATPDRAPRLIELEWGKPGDPRVAIVGKGVCFDSGGLDLKPAQRHAADEEGHGRRSACARAGAADHRPNGCRSGFTCSSRRSKMPSRQRLPARRHRQVAQGHVRRDRQHRCRRPARSSPTP